MSVDRVCNGGRSGLTGGGLGLPAKSGSLVARRAQRARRRPRVQRVNWKTVMADTVIPNVRTFQVFPDIPAPLQPLWAMARNLWWVWNPDAIELFRRLDRKLWEDVYHNPVKLLGAIEGKKLQQASNDEGYLAHMQRVYGAFKAHLDGRGWFKDAHGDKKMSVAYFSAEFGIHES